jgi:hypothetical protein
MMLVRARPERRRVLRKPGQEPLQQKARGSKDHPRAWAEG